jgi:hypothetical protein
VKRFARSLRVCRARRAGRRARRRAAGRAGRRRRRASTAMGGGGSGEGGQLVAVLGGPVWDGDHQVILSEHVTAILVVGGISNVLVSLISSASIDSSHLQCQLTRWGEAIAHSPLHGRRAPFCRGRGIRSACQFSPDCPRGRLFDYPTAPSTRPPRARDRRQVSRAHAVRPRRGTRRCEGTPCAAIPAHGAPASALRRRLLEDRAAGRPIGHARRRGATSMCDPPTHPLSAGSRLAPRPSAPGATPHHRTRSRGALPLVRAGSTK